jgi:hypothetical protein
MGTVVVIWEPETTVNPEETPLNVTRVAAVRFVPRILTVDPTVPEIGRVLTNGVKPDDAT